MRCVSFFSLYVYSPRGSGAASAGSRSLCSRLKSADPAWLPTYAGHARAHARADALLAAMFAKGAVLVPVPGSAFPPSKVWAAERLAFALQGVGLGDAVWPAAYRRFAVRKSATAPSADRPTVQQHFESFAWRRADMGPKKIVLVDDVITRGRTLLALAMRLRAELPWADIRAFALVRTIGFATNVVSSLDPCHGAVRWSGGDARREP